MALQHSSRRRVSLVRPTHNNVWNRSGHVVGLRRSRSGRSASVGVAESGWCQGGLRWFVSHRERSRCIHDEFQATKGQSVCKCGSANHFGCGERPMRMRAPVGRISLAVGLLVVAGCGVTSSTDGSDSAVSQSSATSVMPSESIAAPSSSALAVSPSDWDVLVTADGSGGLIDSVGTTDLEFLGGIGPDEPWLRFGLVLNYCCGEPNSVVFGPDQWSFDVGDVGQLRLDGPLCEGPVECIATERRVRLTPNDATVIDFEVFRDPTGTALLFEGTFTVDAAPLFEWESGAIDDQPMSIAITFHISTPVSPPTGDTTPTATEALPVAVLGGGLYLLDFPLLGVADNSGELSDLLASATEPIDVEALDIDWPAAAVLVVSLGSDLCPLILDGIQIDSGAATPVFVNAGYLECEQPLVSYLVIAAIDRELLADVNQIKLPAEISYGDQDTIAAVDVSPPSADPTLEPTVVTFGESIGTAVLPARGEASTTVLTNGTPVYVVHHHDGTISALDPRGADQDIDGLHQIVRWVAAARNFLNHGAWDEYGRRLDGFRSTDLTSYATRVLDNQVEIGDIVPTPAGSPIAKTNDPPAMSDVTITPGEILTVGAAVELPVGTTSWIAGSVHARPESAVICHIPAETIRTEACPAGSPTAEGIPTTPDAANTYFGPLLATRSDGGFDRIASTSGYAGSAL